MKTAAKLLFLTSLMATFAVGQISQGTFKHINFGSILAFIEWNFIGQNAIGTIGQGYKFADAYAPELPNNIPLLDFFPLTTPRTFFPITPPPPYDAHYFQSFNSNSDQSPSGPDADY